MRVLLSIIAAITLLVVLLFVYPKNGTQISNSDIIHPDSLHFGTLDWSVPDGKEYRNEINGNVLYYAQDKLPLFNIKLSFKAGTIYGEGLHGVSTLYSYALENGGTENYSPQELDSILNLYSIKLSVSSDNSRLSIAMSGLAEFYPIAMDILKDLIHSPRFDSKRLDLDKSVIYERIDHRFDNPAPIMRAAWKKIVYPNSTISKLLTKDDIQSIKKSDLIDYHNLVMNNAPLVVAFSGSVEKNVVESSIDSLFPHTREVKEPTVVEPIVNEKKRFVIVQKPISQAYIMLGNPIFKRPNSEYYPLTLFNEILGGGGFDSKLVTAVRSNAGLTYSIRSGIRTGYLYRGYWVTSLFTKSESINHALGLTIDVIKKSLEEPIDAALVLEKKEQIIQTLPSAFRDGYDIVSTYQENELMGRSIDHYRVFPEKLMSVPLDSVKVSAKNNINVDDFSVVIVGDTAQLFKADTWNGFDFKKLHPTVITEDQLPLLDKK